MPENPDLDAKPEDVAPADSPVTAEDVCPRCGGSGEVDGATCEGCQGTGTVSEAVGGG